MRITHHVTTSTFVLVALFFCGVVVAVEAIETEDEELLASYDAARETWLQNVSFYGTYTHKWADFDTEEEVRTKNIDDKYITAKGFICKVRDKYRLQVLYANKPDLVEKSGDIVVVSNRSNDVIANRNFRILFNPEQGTSFAASGSMNKRSEQAAFSVVPALQGTPFCLFLDTIAEMPSNTSRNRKYTVTRLGEGREVLSFMGKSASGHKIVREVTVRMSEKTPVVEQIALFIFGNEESEKPLSTWVRKVLEWKACDGVSVPSRIRVFSGPLKSIASNKDQWAVVEWRSDDLGNRPPTDKDFVLQLPPDVGLVGMNHYPKGGLVDIDAITDDDFLPSGSLYLEQETWGTVELESNRYTAFRWTFMILGIALIVWGLVRIYMKRK